MGVVISSYCKGKGRGSLLFPFVDPPPSHSSFFNWNFRACSVIEHTLTDVSVDVSRVYTFLTVVHFFIVTTRVVISKNNSLLGGP